MRNKVIPGPTPVVDSIYDAMAQGNVESYRQTICCDL